MVAWGKDAHGGITRYFWAKSYNLGGVLLLLIARAVFKPHDALAKTSTTWGLGCRK